MVNASILKADKCEIVTAEWGTLTWFAGAKLQNSQDMTLGKCVIKPGCENPMHSHPNCSEILVVMQGTILHTIEDGKEVELKPGDTITLPPNLPHKARNTSDDDAVLLIAFSSADRQTKGE
jgi:quercetin dioxygenase-like cupin family protein